MTKEHARRRFRHAKEDYLRHSLTTPSLMPAAEREAMRRIAEGALASVGALEQAYLEERNPVHVWDAITQLHFAAPILDISIQLPHWVLAYLITAASEIMGRAVTHQSGNRHSPKPPIKNPDGTMTRFSDSYAGLTAAQRRDVVLEALGFKGPQGWNPLAQAHRDNSREIRLSRVDALLRQGHTIKSATKELNDDPGLKASDDPVRKIRRERRKWQAKT